MSKETHYFRVISNLDNKTKDTLEKETANDDIVVSNNDTKATPKTVFVQDKLVAAYNFDAIDLDEHVNAVDDEINEVKAAKLVKSCSLLLEHQEYPRYLKPQYRSAPPMLLLHTQERSLQLNVMTC